MSSLRMRLALWICPALLDELSALMTGNTKVVLENSRLLDRIKQLSDTNGPETRD